MSILPRYMTNGDLRKLLRDMADLIEGKYFKIEKSGQQVAEEIAKTLRETARQLP